MEQALNQYCGDTHGSALVWHELPGGRRQVAIMQAPYLLTDGLPALVRARLMACSNPFSLRVHEAGTGKPRGGAAFPVTGAVLVCYAG